MPLEHLKKLKTPRKPRAAPNQLAEFHLPTPTARLLNQSAVVLQDQANYSAAEPLYRRALALDENHRGRSHPTIAIRLNNLSSLFYDTDRREEAEPMLARALRIVEDSLGGEHPDSVLYRKNLAILREEMGI